MSNNLSPLSSFQLFHFKQFIPPSSFSYFMSNNLSPLSSFQLFHFKQFIPPSSFSYFMSNNLFPLSSLQLFHVKQFIPTIFSSVISCQTIYSHYLLFSYFMSNKIFHYLHFSYFMSNNLFSLPSLDDRKNKRKSWAVGRSIFHR